MRSRLVQALDECGVEESAAYSARMSRWVTGALEAFDHCIWRLMVYISFKSRSPLRHLRHFMMKVDESECAGKRAMLVWGKAQEIQAEFDELLQPEDWTYHIEQFPEPCRLRASVWVLQIVLHGALDSHRRIVLPLLKFPH